MVEMELTKIEAAPAPAAEEAEEGEEESMLLLESDGMLVYHGGGVGESLSGNIHSFNVDQMDVEKSDSSHQDGQGPLSFSSCFHLHSSGKICWLLF